MDCVAYRPVNLKLGGVIGHAMSSGPVCVPECISNGTVCVPKCPMVPNVKCVSHRPVNLDSLIGLAKSSGPVCVQ